MEEQVPSLMQLVMQSEHQVHLEYQDLNLMHYELLENWEVVHIEPERLDIEVEWFVGKFENQNH